MKQYTKPMVSIDDGMAEGVYAASGSSSASIGISGPNVINNWGTSGQSTLSLDLNQMKLSQLTVTLTFNMDISNGWGGGASATFSGKSLSLYWYSAPSTADITLRQMAT